jgi:hypothetical protein
VNQAVRHCRWTCLYLLTQIVRLSGVAGWHDIDLPAI